MELIAELLACYDDHILGPVLTQFAALHGQESARIASMWIVGWLSKKARGDGHEAVGVPADVTNLLNLSDLAAGMFVVVNDRMFFAAELIEESRIAILEYVRNNHRPHKNYIYRA